MGEEGEEGDEEEGEGEEGAGKETGPRSRVANERIDDYNKKKELGKEKREET